MKIEKLLYIVLLFFVILVACEKEGNDYQSDAVITGPDFGQCICCGGYFITIGDSNYHFDSLPVTSDIDLSSSTFPISVRLDWLYERKCTDFQYIEIVRIEER